MLLKFVFKAIILKVYIQRITQICQNHIVFKNKILSG